MSSIGGATLAGFTLPTAQKLFAKPGKLDQIRVAAKDGVTPEALVAEIQKILPQGTQVRTGEAQAQEDASDTNEFISFLRTFLLVFGGIALFVGAFVIANSLSITIAQRTREFATLRTLGASRQQIMVSVTIEAFVVGLVASIVGLLLGLGLAKGLFALFDAVGFTLPNSGLLFQGHTILYSLLVGVGVTVLAGMYPALLATGVPPIAAVREGAVLPSDPFDPIRGTPQAVVVTGVGIAIAAVGIVARPWTTLFAIVLAVIGLVLVLFGNSLFRSRVVGAVVTIALGALALLYGLFVHGLGTSQVLLWLGSRGLAALRRRRPRHDAARAAAVEGALAGRALGDARPDDRGAADLAPDLGVLLALPLRRLHARLGHLARPRARSSSSSRS